MNILLPLTNAFFGKSSQSFAIIRQNLTNLGTISDAISKAIQDKNILPAESHKILQNMENYCKLKEEIRRETKQK